MATPRHRLIDPQQPLFYHLVSRCVRKSWLCGWDKTTRRDYSHRKNWLIRRLEQLSIAFPVEVHAYAIMSNHFHLVVYYDPLACSKWADEDVVRRWLCACPPRSKDGTTDVELLTLLAEQLLQQPEKISAIRRRLGSLSTFMQLLKQPIARKANLEDGCKGHFFEQRFYSGALLDEAAVQAAMAYVDLNPIRAKIAKTLAECKHTSLAHRLRQEDLKALLPEDIAPVFSGLERKAKLPIALAAYIQYLEGLIHLQQASGEKLSRWQQWVSALKKQQRVYGSMGRIANWLAERNMQLREISVPQV